MKEDAMDDVAKVAAGLSEAERAWLASTPLQEPADAGVIAWRSGDGNGGAAFAHFARMNAVLFQRQKNYAGTALTYRLSPLGQAVRDYLKGQTDDR